jgi:RNA polymerase sigma factor (sigma-70 family)
MRQLDYLRQALDKLNDHEREALRMRYLEDLPSKEIAKRLGRTDGAVRVLLTRSKQKLAQAGVDIERMTATEVDERPDGQ